MLVHACVADDLTGMGRMVTSAVYQTEHCIISQHEGRNVILMQGFILNAAGSGTAQAHTHAQSGQGAGQAGGNEPFYYRLVLGQAA